MYPHYYLVKCDNNKKKILQGNFKIYVCVYIYIFIYF